MNEIADHAQVPGTTWWDVITQHAHHYPGRKVFAFKDLCITYSELIPLVEACAQKLSARGIVKGDRVAVLAPPRPEAMITFFAAARLGALWVGLNPKYQVPELNYVIGHAQPKLVISVQSFENRDYAGDLQDALEGIATEAHPQIVLFDGTDPSSGALLDALSQDATVGEAQLPTHNTDPTVPCMLVYTSGTTGKPKGVLLRQRELIYRSTVQAQMFKTASHPVVINFAPINHIGGMHFRGLSQVLAAGTIVYQDRYRPSEVGQLIEQHKVNMLMLGSTMLQMLLREPSFDLKIMKKMEWFIFSGAAIPMQILSRVKEYCPAVGSTYGLTESCGSVSYIVGTDALEPTAYTIGRSVPEGQLRVADVQGGHVTIGQQGELQVKKEYCMQGYFRDDATTAETFTADGWLKTGDMATQEPDGYFRLVGRIKEMYKSGGYNVYPREIEVVLEQHPQVLMSAVIPVDDELYQQVGHAYLIPKVDASISEEELNQWCRERLANYKVPKRIFLRASLPMLSIGKVDKIALQSLS